MESGRRRPRGRTNTTLTCAIGNVVEIVWVKEYAQMKLVNFWSSYASSFSRSVFSIFGILLLAFQLVVHVSLHPCLLIPRGVLQLHV